MTELLETYIENREMVQPHHANTVGNTHGGNVMKFMDEVGAMASMRFAGETCVTARVEGIDFEQPIHVGDTAFLTAYVYDAGRTSVNVRVTVYREDIRTGERELTTDSRFIYVAIDDDGKPTPVPELTVGSDRGEELREAALSAGT